MKKSKRIGLNVFSDELKEIFNLRSDVEDERVVTEDTRKLNEIVRITNENKRISNNNTWTITLAGYETRIDNIEVNKASIVYVDGKVKTNVPVGALFTDTIVSIVDNLVSIDMNKALSANQGKVLNDSLVAHKEDYATQRQQNNLKVATVEKGLNDYKSTMANVNVNQEAKQKVTGYGTISLPRNTANGQVSVGVKGNSYTNILGTHENKNSMLAQSSGAGISFVQNGGIGNTADSRVIKLIGGNRYLIKIDFLSPSTNNINMLRVYTGSVIPDGTVLGSVITNGLSSYAIFTAPSTDTVKLAFRNNVADSNYYHDKSIVVDLTSIGETETDINKLIQKYPYINGTKSTISASRLKSVGENIFDKKELSNLKIASLTGDGDLGEIKFSEGAYANSVSANSPFARYFYSLFEAGKTYTISRNMSNYTDGSQGRMAILEFNENPVFYFTLFGAGTTYNTVTIPQNWDEYKQRPLLIYGRHYNVFSEIQIVEGDTQAPYEPYTESTQYLPNVGELRSLPNGTKDEIRVSGGKAEHIKRVSDKYILQPNDLASPVSVLNVSIVSCRELPNQKITLNQASILHGIFNIQGISETVASNLDMVENIGKYYISASTGRIIFIVAKGTTLEQARTQLNGLTLTYQLAEPIITPIQTSGNLISYPSGTVYVENVVADAGNYTTKFDTKELQLPIKSIDKLIKYNFTTGVQTVLDTSLAVINADKKSFTHPGLANKDMVFVDYYYDVESTLGETTIEYYDSRHTIKDTTNNKFYKWDIKSTNGVPTVALTEVL